MAQRPSGASHVSGLRTWIFSYPSCSMRSAASSVTTSPDATIRSSVVMSRMVVRATRPRMIWPRGTSTRSPFITALFTTPRVVPQSIMVPTTFCVTSASLRVR